MPQNRRNVGKKTLCVVEQKKKTLRRERFSKNIRTRLLIDGAVKKVLAHSSRKNNSDHPTPHFQTSATKSRCLEDIIFSHFFYSMHQTNTRARKGSKTRLRHFLREMPYPSKTFKTQKGTYDKCLRACLAPFFFAYGGLYGACLNPFWHVSAARA